MLKLYSDRQLLDFLLHVEEITNDSSLGYKEQICFIKEQLGIMYEYERKALKALGPLD